LWTQHTTASALVHWKGAIQIGRGKRKRVII